MNPKEIEEFLNKISQIESGGGKNFKHKTLQSGMHKGQSAIGTYGLMPNTVDEIIENMPETTPELDKLYNMSPKEQKAYLESHPQTEKVLASKLAEKVLSKQGGDQEKAAYAWNQGHNLSPEKIERRDYLNSDYVQRFNKIRGVKSSANPLKFNQLAQPPVQEVETPISLEGTPSGELLKSYLDQSYGSMPSVRSTPEASTQEDFNIPLSDFPVHLEKLPSTERVNAFLKLKKSIKGDQNGEA